MTVRQRPFRIGLAGAIVLVVALAEPWVRADPQGIAITTDVDFATIDPAELRPWLSYLASDELEGRESFTEGYGLAAAFIAERLRDFGVEPLGEHGTYFQNVSRRGYRVTRHSRVTIERDGTAVSFTHGDHVTFPVTSGGNQTLTFDRVMFVGDGAVPPADASLAGTLAVWMPTTAAAGRGGRGGRGANRSAALVTTAGAAAAIQFVPTPAPPTEAEVAAEAAVEQAQQALAAAETELADAQRAAGAGRRGRGAGFGRGGRASEPAADLTTVQRMDDLVAPQLTADEVFFEALLAGAPVSLTDLRGMVERDESLPVFAVDGLTVTIEVQNDFEVVSAELTKNVIGIVRGTDPDLSETYVLIGAHLDHEGYNASGAGGGARCPEAPGDFIFNGADDDGSGSTALLGIAQALATGPRPRRSVVFVWHAAEEQGLLGSRYHAAFPVVPLERVEAQFNIDMIGRNRDNDPGQANNLFIVGADRISTDLHNLIVDTNAALPAPLHLDYEYNDPEDPQSFYTRSDHYSYAQKGIPVAFFFTGTHPDYHCPTDEVDKILFPKLARVAELVYRSVFNLANATTTLRRDQQGPLAGRGFSGRIDR